MLISKIKEESLHIYLITSATCFSNISISTLSDMFELPIKNVYGIISKLILNGELMVGKVFRIKLIFNSFSLGYHRFIRRNSRDT
jgi:hypothetical protein